MIVLFITPLKSSNKKVNNVIIKPQINAKAKSKTINSLNPIKSSLRLTFFNFKLGVHKYEIIKKLIQFNLYELFFEVNWI